MIVCICRPDLVQLPGPQPGVHGQPGQREQGDRQAGGRGEARDDAGALFEFQCLLSDPPCLFILGENPSLPSISHSDSFCCLLSIQFKDKRKHEGVFRFPHSVKIKYSTVCSDSRIKLLSV